MMGTTNTTLSSRPWKHNLTHWVTFELYPEWTGKTCYGFKGMAYHRIYYTNGTMVVLKAFRHREGTASDWIPYKERCDVTRRMAATFNKILAKKTCDTKINVMKPIDVVMDTTSYVMLFMRILMRFDKTFGEDEVVLFEEFLNGDFKTFVNSSGHTTGNGPDVLDAFCHFTYHESEGNLVVCNLKGIAKGDEYKLSNPTIHSRDGRYGDKDKRDEGINTFFVNHTCNAFCQSFAKPVNIHGSKKLNDENSKQSEVNNEDVFTNEKHALIERHNCDREPVRPPEYSLSDRFGPPSYTTCDGNT
ncbi:alpha-protein kinase vwkA-like [Ruditapes philippinarum]|uniref:alpha-protein kinase vwkA-like n=1 Tax=Ruditapes philippinarum TaxID=129788 RepID=UPI00295ABB0E|nr:alpha-protein kinase vwkA-like [Ruditapes philippinarum]XP_060582520.1 alpha-protein kinase vwkA-like [Ruditapes philippinarum]XP_060582521.1 alpha-protein kinase vwkA-like [Ruditapes philippinarum]